VTGLQNRISLEQLSKRLLLEESKKGKVPVHAMRAYRGGRCIGKYNCHSVMRFSTIRWLHFPNSKNEMICVWNYSTAR